MTRAALALALLFIGCKPAPDPGFAQRLQAPGLDNFARVHDGLYRGAQPSAQGLEELRSRGVKTLINLRSNHSQKKQAEALGFRVVEIPLHADVFGSTPPSDEQIKLFFETVLNPVHQPVYFHCAHGKDRTGTMAALYRIEIDGWPADRAIQEMQAFGYHDVYKDLIAFVRAYSPRGFKAP